MKRVINTSEALGTVELPEGMCEVYALADANYEEGTNRLVVRLDSFLRKIDLRAREEQFAANWLPKPETITETVDPEEGLEMSREIFHHWVRKVRQATPSLHNLTI